jgi:hypothetical protein
MGNVLFVIAELAAVIVFISALAQGKGFGNAVRMSLGVLILGVVAVIALGVLAGILQLTVGLLTIALWVALIYAIVVVLAKVLRGSAV